MPTPKVLVYLFLGCTLPLTACTSGDQSETDGRRTSDVDTERHQRIDAHGHYSRDRPYFADFFEKWNMRAVSVYVVGGPSPDRTRWESMKELHAQYPDRLFLCTSFDPFPVDEPNYAEDVIARLEEDIAAGASMVKVWKVVGMDVQDSDGEYVHIDDPRYQPIWEFLAAQDIPVIAHIGEPRIAWQPLEEGQPHAGYFESHPEYHAYQHPEMPRWKEIMAARDRWLENNPDLTVIGAHLGSMSHDVDAIAERLEAYPNFYVDTAARFVDLAHQPSDSVRAFFIEYQDRILYGTDMGVGEPDDSVSTAEMEDERASMEKILRVHEQYLTRSDSMYFDSPMGSPNIDTKGLGLPAEVVRKVYFKNAAKLLDL